MKQRGSPSFHHVGFVVASIEKITEPLERALGVERAGPVVHDPLQQARVAFLCSEGPGAAAVELVEADGETSHRRSIWTAAGACTTCVTRSTRSTPSSRATNDPRGTS